MNDLTRRGFMKASSVLGAALAGLTANKLAAQAGGFQAAGGPGGPHRREKKGAGIQSITALCEVTGGGQKVYGFAAEYDAEIRPASLSTSTYTVGVFPAARGYFPGMPQAPDKNATHEDAHPRGIVAIYTNAVAALRDDKQSVAGKYVIAEFAHDADLSLPTTDSDKVSLRQDKDVQTVSGAIYAASAAVWTNAGERENDVVIRGIDAWEQNHWWWDDTRSAWLEYSIHLPKSFLQEGGEDREYPLLIAITHSGTSYDGTCLATLTEQCIASIWALPEEQAERECVVITPRYERTTLNDYWEHTHDVENTYRLVQSFLKNTWNFGNPNREDRRDKVLKIDAKRVYCTGWSMGAMTSLWMMAKHPETFAAGLIIAGQQRPADMVDLAHQNVLILTGSNDEKATPWNEQCVPVWEKAGAKVTRPTELLDPKLIFPVGDQKQLTAKIEGHLNKGGNITFLTFADVDHMGSARKFFHVRAAREWLFAQKKA